SGAIKTTDGPGVALGSVGTFSCALQASEAAIRAITTGIRRIRPVPRFRSGIKICPPRFWGGNLPDVARFRYRRPRSGPGPTPDDMPPLACRYDPAYGPVLSNTILPSHSASRAGPTPLTLSRS